MYATYLHATLCRLWRQVGKKEYSQAFRWNEYGKGRDRGYVYVLETRVACENSNVKLMYYYLFKKWIMELRPIAFPTSDGTCIYDPSLFWWVMQLISITNCFFFISNVTQIHHPLLFWWAMELISIIHFFLWVMKLKSITYFLFYK